MKRHKEHGQPKRSRAAHTPSIVDRDMDGLELNSSVSLQRNNPNEEEDDFRLHPGYRDRAAERRREEEENAKSQHFAGGGQTKGLDFALLELQKKGIRTVDVLEGDTRSARIKLAAKNIIQLFPPKTDDKPCTGWKIKLSFSNSARPTKVYDESLASKDQATDSKTTKPVFTLKEAQLIMNAWKSRRIRDKVKSNLDLDTIDGDENNHVEYAEEVQELSDEEDRVHQREQPAKASQAKSEKPKESDAIDDDDEFDMFGGILKKENLESSVPRPASKEVDFMSLSLDDLKNMLEKVEQAIILRRALDEQQQIAG